MFFLFLENKKGGKGRSDKGFNSALDFLSLSPQTKHSAHLKHRSRSCCPSCSVSVAPEASFQ